MRQHDPRQYLAVRGFDPTCIIECMICPKKFVAQEGVAFPATANGEPIMGYFCSEACFLTAMPVTNCYRA